MLQSSLKSKCGTVAHIHNLNPLSPQHILKYSKAAVIDRDPIAWTSLRLGKPNTYTLLHLTRECTSTGPFTHCQQLHSHILKSGFISNVYVSTALINFYVKFDRVQEAHHLFAEIPEPSVVSWNSLITGYVHSGQFRKALRVFLELERSELVGDVYSFTAALSACGRLSLVHVGKSVHSKIVKCGVENTVFVSNCLVSMYGKCGCVAEAMKVFEDMNERDTISWNSALATNARNGKIGEAFAVLHRMPCPDTISYNELIDGIARFGYIEDAIAVLSKMPYPNSSSWNSIIAGYTNRGRAREALEFFCKMHLDGVRIDEFTYSSILSGVANLSEHTWGSLIHSSVVKSGLDEYIVVGSALVDMYFKCGQIEKAERLFQSLPEKNLVTWNAVISGYAYNGNSRKVIEIFEQLKTMKDLQPDEITFLNVFSACWHSRIPLKVVKHYFDMMIIDYMIAPMPEHCSLMIRLMGQDGDVSKAESMINELGFDSCGMVWKALLGACMTCGNIEVAEVAAKKVIELDGDNDYVYVVMSNIYACHGKWEDMGDIRKVMKDRNVRKEAGWSRIEVQ